MTDKNSIRALVEEKLQGTDLFLTDIKLSAGKLSVFVDKPSGIKLEECMDISRYLSDRLEETGFMETHEIEVSSPGMDSPLMVPQQYQRRTGQELKVNTTEGKEIKGILLKADNSEIELKETVIRKEEKKKITAEVMHKIPYSMIRDARLIINFKLK